jgi:predicted nucleotidyltransferase
MPIIRRPSMGQRQAPPTKGVGGQFQKSPENNKLSVIIRNVPRGTGRDATIASTLSKTRVAPRRVGVVSEEQRSDAALSIFDFLRKEAADAPPAKAKRFIDRAWAVVEEAEPVRVSYAARVLGLTPQALRSWINRGLLHEVPGSSPARVTLASVARVREVLADLRKAGQERNLMPAVETKLQPSAGSPREDRGRVRRRRGYRYTPARRAHPAVSTVSSAQDIIDDAVAAGLARQDAQGRISQAEQRYLQEHWPLLCQLRDAGAQSGLSLVVLFGSAARGDETHDSDIDLYIAAASDERRKAERLADDVERLTGKSVDVVRSRAAAGQPLLLDEVITTGRPLFDPHGQWQALRERAPQVKARARRARQQLARQERAAMAAMESR